MLVLLGVSTLAAALVPVEQSSEDEETTTTTEPAPKPSGRLVTRRVEAGARRPATIRLRLGDQLALTVTSRRADQVAIGRLDEIADVGRDEPARFNLLPFEPATHRIRLLEARRTIGRIEVSRRRAPRRSEDREPR